MSTSSPASAEAYDAQQGPEKSMQEWLQSQTCFDPDIDYEDDVSDAFKDIEEGQLAKHTSLYALIAAEKYSNPQEAILDYQQAVTLLSSRGHGNRPTGLEVFAISRLHATTESALQPKAQRNEHGRLQVSQQVFRLLLSTYQVPIAFVTSLARPYLVCGTGFRRSIPDSWDHWCLIPVRVVTSCRVQASDHTKSRAGSNQMDPFHYIHLSGAQVDIRGSHIGLFIQHNTSTRGITVIAVNLLDSRLRDLIEEPLVRIKEAIKQRSSMGLVISSRFIHLIYLSSALRWWNNVLLCFNQQLVMHEKQLQKEIAAQTSAFSDESKDINTALHIMAAHLHRYKSELHRVESILSELRSPKFDAGSLKGEGGDSTMTEGNMENHKVQQLMSQLSAITSFSDELERKIQNILTLLFNQIQVTNDKTLQAILKATQVENKLSQEIEFQSHELTRSMKNDGVAMKTIAVLTMLFLPATSFAAILSMPFFNTIEYLTVPARAWIWTILTVTFTFIAFGVFAYVIRRERRTSKSDGNDNSQVKGS